MPILYGEEKTDAEVRAFVTEYVASVKAEKRDRYHDILSLVPGGGHHILDYGCGWGHYALAMRDMGNTVLAIDLSGNEIDICRLVWGEQPGVAFEKRGIDSLGDAAFDIVVSNQVIEHVHNTGHYLSEINRVLKTGGQMVVSLPNIMNPRHFLAMLVGDIEGRLKRTSEEILQHYDKTHHHIHVWHPQSFVTLCASVGFRCERYLPMEGIPFPFRRPFRPYLYWKNRRLRNWSYTMAFSFTKVREVRIDCRE